jgi:hypothetical protein
VRPPGTATNPATAPASDRNAPCQDPFEAAHATTPGTPCPPATPSPGAPAPGHGTR